VSSRSLKLPATHAPSGNSKVTLTTGKDNDQKFSLDGSTPLTPTPASPAISTNGSSKPNSFKDAKQVRENAKPSRVGGGIFRASGNIILFTPRENKGNPTATLVVADPPTKSDSSTSNSYKPVPKPPNTLFDFVKSWGSLRSTEERWQLINSIPPAYFPTLCKTSLEPSMLVSIMETFLEVTKDDDSQAKRTTIREYMENFAKIPRFNTLLLFLSKSEKKLANSVWMAVDVDQPTGLWSVVV